MNRLVLLAALALPLAAARSDPLVGYTAGKPEQCVSLSRLQGPEIVDDHTILYRQNGRRIWRTGPVGNCGYMRPFDTLIVDVYGGQLCANDRFRVLSQSTIIPGPYCRFRPFVPYDKPTGRTG
jgi:hypothetical protein